MLNNFLQLSLNSLALSLNMVNAYAGSYSLCGFNFHGVHHIVLLRVNFGMHIAVERAAFTVEFNKIMLRLMAIHLLILIHDVV